MEIKQKSNRGGARPNSGRKKGSTKEHVEAKKRAAADFAMGHIETAFATLAQIAATGESESARVSAANSLIDRAFGKAPQPQEHSGKVAFSVVIKGEDADL